VCCCDDNHNDNLLTVGRIKSLYAKDVSMELTQLNVINIVKNSDGDDRQHIVPWRSGTAAQGEPISELSRANFS